MQKFQPEPETESKADDDTAHSGNEQQVLNECPQIHCRLLLNLMVYIGLKKWITLLENKLFRRNFMYNCTK